MRKLTTRTLSQMAAELSQLTEPEQSRILGGTTCPNCGSPESPDCCTTGIYYCSYDEVLFMIDTKTWVGGYVEGMGYMEEGSISGHYYSGVYTEEEMIQLMFRNDWNGGWVNGEYLDGDHEVTGLYTLEEAASVARNGGWNGGWIDGYGYVGSDSSMDITGAYPITGQYYTYEDMMNMADRGDWQGGMVMGLGYVDTVEPTSLEDLTAVSGIVGPKDLLKELILKKGKEKGLDSPFEKELFDQYWEAKGDLELTKEQFEGIAHYVKDVYSYMQDASYYMQLDDQGLIFGPEDDITIIDDELYIKRVVNFYGNSQYDKGLGRATVYFDLDTNEPVGFFDIYDFDKQEEGSRDSDSEKQTRIVGTIGGIVGAKAYKITYGKHE